MKARLVRMKFWCAMAVVVAVAFGMAWDADAATRRMLLVGDSWPMFMWTGALFWDGRAFQETLIEKGYGQWEEWGEHTAIGTSMAYEWAANADMWYDLQVTGRLDVLRIELEKNPTIDIVHLCLGGNDFGRADYRELIDYEEYGMQSLTMNGDPTGGTFTLTFNAESTAPIAYDAPASAVQSALEALSTIGAGNIAVQDTSGGARYFCTFQGPFTLTPVPMMSANGSGLTGDGDEGVTVNDVEFHHGWQKRWGTDSPGEYIFFDAIADQVRVVIETLLDVRPNIRVALCDYDYMNDDGGGGTVQEKNEAGIRLGMRKGLMVADVNAQPEYLNRCWYIAPAGLMQYVFGYPNPGDGGVQKWDIYGPMGAPGNVSGETIDPPIGYPDYILGGDIRYPSPAITILSGVGGGDIHLNKLGYWELARYCIDEFYGEWLDLPAVIAVTRTTTHPFIPGQILSPTNLSQVTFEVTFSEPVTGVDEVDFDVVMGGGLANASIESVTEAKDGSTHSVVVNTGSGDGTLVLAVLDNGSITALDDGSPLAGDVNGYFAYGNAYEMDRSVITELPLGAWPAVLLAVLGLGAWLPQRRSRGL